MLNLMSYTMVYKYLIPRHKVSLCKLVLLCTHHREVRLVRNGVVCEVGSDVKIQPSASYLMGCR